MLGACQVTHTDTHTHARTVNIIILTYKINFWEKNKKEKCKLTK